MSRVLDVSALGAVAGAIQRRIDDGTSPGACACVWYRDQKVYETCLGIADPAGTPLRADHIFHLASMTKAITAAAVLQQMELGRVHLDDPIGKFIPELAKLNVAELDAEGKIVGTHPASRPVTVLDCLTHTSGIGSRAITGELFSAVRMREGERLSDFVPRYASMPLAFEPGSQTDYSPVAAPDVAACIVEKVSGEEYSAYLSRHLFGPLGMVDTCYDLPNEKRPRLVDAFGSRDGKLVPSHISRAEIFSDLTYLVSGGGGLHSTLGDYSRFVRMLSRFGELDNVRVLKPESVRLMTTPRQPLTLKNMSPGYIWGLLVRIATEDPNRPTSLAPGAVSWSGAWGTHFIMDRELDMFGVFMTNSTYCGGAGSQTDRDFENAIMSCVREKA